MPMFLGEAPPRPGRIAATPSNASHTERRKVASATKSLPFRYKIATDVPLPVSDIAAIVILRQGPFSRMTTML